jgi:hypothetical protein
VALRHDQANVHIPARFAVAGGIPA